MIVTLGNYMPMQGPFYTLLHNSLGVVVMTFILNHLKTNRL